MVLASISSRPLAKCYPPSAVRHPPPRRRYLPSQRHRVLRRLPARYDPDRKVIPKDPDAGRNNGQGLESLTACLDGKTLYALMQSPPDAGRWHQQLVYKSICHTDFSFNSLLFEDVKNAEHEICHSS